MVLLLLLTITKDPEAPNELYIETFYDCFTQMVHISAIGTAQVDLKPASIQEQQLSTVNCHGSSLLAIGHVDRCWPFCGLFSKSTGHVGRGNPGHGLPSRAGVLNF